MNSNLNLVSSRPSLVKNRLMIQRKTKARILIEKYRKIAKILSIK